MNSEMRDTYPPLNTIKPVCNDVWIVDGPVIRFGPLFLKMRFPTRMTIIRLAENRLFIHSPTALTPALKAEIEILGKVQWIVGPNRIHYWWIPDWKKAFGNADIFLAPRIEEQAAGRIPDDHSSLDRDEGYPWDSELQTISVTGRYMTEFIFYHRASRTLVLTDLIENFEPRKLGSHWMQLLTWLGGVRAPHGGMPRDMRFTYPRSELKAAVETMISLNPERVILAHGHWYETQATNELRRAFHWLLN
jgi:hypothetical protein